MGPHTVDTGHRRQRKEHGTLHRRHRAQETKKEAWDPIQETQGTGGKERSMGPHTGDTGRGAWDCAQGTQEAKNEAWDPADEA